MKRNLLLSLAFVLAVSILIIIFNKIFIISFKHNSNISAIASIKANTDTNVKKISAAPEADAVIKNFTKNT